MIRHPFTSEDVNELKELVQCANIAAERAGKPSLDIEDITLANAQEVNDKFFEFISEHQIESLLNDVKKEREKSKSQSVVEALNPEAISQIQKLQEKLNGFLGGGLTTNVVSPKNMNKALGIEAENRSNVVDRKKMEKQLGINPGGRGGPS